METTLNNAINAPCGFNTTQKKLLKRIANENPKIVYASADHTVNPSDTLANDSELYFDVRANRKYIVEAFLFTSADGADGIKVAFATATDATAARITWSYNIDNVANQLEAQTDLTSPGPTGVAAAITNITGNGFIHAGADGRITLQSALVADNNAATTIYKGSYLKVYEVE